MAWPCLRLQRAPPKMPAVRLHLRVRARARARRRQRSRCPPRIWTAANSGDASTTSDSRSLFRRSARAPLSQRAGRLWASRPFLAAGRASLVAARARVLVVGPPRRCRCQAQARPCPFAASRSTPAPANSCGILLSCAARAGRTAVSKAIVLSSRARGLDDDPARHHRPVSHQSCSRQFNASRSATQRC